MQKRVISFFTILSILTVASCFLYVLWGLNKNNIDYNLPRRLIKLVAFIATGSAIGVSTVVFQTVTQNNILTPSIMGLDNLYILIQTLLIFFLGSGELVLMTRAFDYFISILVMIAFSFVLFKVIFRGENMKITTVMLAGIVFGSLFESLSTFMQVIIDPNEYDIILDRITASFNKINSSLLGFSSLMIFMCLIYIFSTHRKLDVMSLGREISINLGIQYDAKVTGFMLVLSVMTAASTALVGSITFLGLLTASLSRQLLKTYRHRVVMIGAGMSSVFAIVIGQFVTERVFNYGTKLSVIINFAGGIYFILLMLREGRK